jgi:hypothetical protein
LWGGHEPCRVGLNRNGIAIGAGTDVAVETGDIVLMKSDPADVLAAIRLSKATVRKMKQNLFWAAILQRDRHSDCRGSTVSVAGSDAPTRIRRARDVGFQHHGRLEMRCFCAEAPKATQ